MIVARASTSVTNTDIHHSTLRHSSTLKMRAAVPPCVSSPPHIGLFLAVATLKSCGSCWRVEPAQTRVKWARPRCTVPHTSTCASALGSSPGKRARVAFTSGRRNAPQRTYGDSSAADICSCCGRCAGLERWEIPAA
jgi:hypothetical protein